MCLIIYIYFFSCLIWRSPVDILAHWFVSMLFNWMEINFIGLVGRVFNNGLGDRDSILGCVIPKTLKRVLIPTCLTLSNIRYVSRVKWSNPGKGVAPSPTPRCSSYWKGSLQVALDYGHQLYFTMWLIVVIYIYIVSKVGDLNRGSPEGSLFNSYYTEL